MVEEVPVTYPSPEDPTVDDGALSSPRRGRETRRGRRTHSPSVTGSRGSDGPLLLDTSNSSPSPTLGCQPPVDLRVPGVQDSSVTLPSSLCKLPDAMGGTLSYSGWHTSTLLREDLSTREVRRGGWRRRRAPATLLDTTVLRTPSDSVEAGKSSARVRGWSYRSPRRSDAVYVSSRSQLLPLVSLSMVDVGPESGVGSVGRRVRLLSVPTAAISVAVNDRCRSGVRGGLFLRVGVGWWGRGGPRVGPWRSKGQKTRDVLQSKEETLRRRLLVMGPTEGVRSEHVVPMVGRNTFRDENRNGVGLWVDVPGRSLRVRVPPPAPSSLVRHSSLRTSSLRRVSFEVRN